MDKLLKCQRKKEITGQSQEDDMARMREDFELGIEEIEFDDEDTTDPMESEIIKKGKPLTMQE